MGAGLCSCHRAPPKHRLGPNKQSPYRVLSPPLEPEDKPDGVRYSSRKYSNRVAPPLLPLYVNIPPESTAICRREADITGNMINIVALEGSSDVGSINGSEMSQSCSSMASDSKPLIGFNRSKPPPKPPRLNTSTYFNQSDALTPTPSIRSIGSDSFKSSLADVTHTLDMSVQSHDASFQRYGRQMGFQTKVYRILAQARDFLVCEINPTNILGYLVEKQVIDRRAAQELRQCYSKVAQCEQLLDLLTSKGQYEFKVFCDALRYVEKEHYIADLLLVLDSLIEIMIDAGGGFNRGGDMGYDSMEGPLNQMSGNCPTCAGNNNDDDLLGETPTFDIEISYMDIVTGALKSLSDVNTIKIDRPLTPRGFNKSFSFDMDDADRYVPVISVSLFHQCLGKENIQSLSNLLERFSCIKELSITKCHLPDSWVKILGRAISKNRSLARLDIKFNAIDEENAKLFAEGLKHNQSIKIINLVGTELTGASSELIILSLAGNSCMTELDLGFNDLRDVGCKALASYLSTNGNIRKLRIRDNSISAYGCNYLFRSLRRNFRLSVLDLSSNKIGNLSTANLAEMLLSNRTLRDLNLENCNISAVGCPALARALKTNSTLKHLELSMNPITDKGISSLSDGLKYNHVLDTLCLNMCQIGNKGFLDILDALRSNATMTSLKLCYNDIGRGLPEVRPTSPTSPKEPVPEPPPIDLVYENLCQVLQFNKNLKVLLWGNRLDGPADITSCSTEM